MSKRSFVRQRVSVCVCAFQSFTCWFSIVLHFDRNYFVHNFVSPTFVCIENQLKL